MARLSVAALAIACLAAVHPTTAAPEPPTTAGAAHRLSLDDAVRIGMERNGRLRVTVAEVRAAAEAAKAAGKPPPLTLTLEPASLVEQLFGALGHVFDLSGKRKYRSRAAENELVAAVAGADEFRLELKAAIRTSYWGLALCRLRQTERGALRNTAAVLLQAAQEQAAAGAIARSEVAEREADLARADLELVEAGAAVETAQASLNVLLAQPVGTSLDLTDPPRLADTDLPPLADLTARALAARPVITRVEALVAAARNLRRADRRERLPDIEAALVREDEVTYGRLGFQLPLVDFGSIRHTVRAAIAREDGAAAQAELTRQEVEAEVASAHRRLAAAQSAERDWSGRLVPLARQRVEQARRRHECGAAAVGEVLTAQQEASEVAIGALDALEEALVAQAALARALGTDDLPNESDTR